MNKTMPKMRKKKGTCLINLPPSKSQGTNNYSQTGCLFVNGKVFD